MSQIVEDLLSRIKPDLSKQVQQLQAAKNYVLRKQQRTEAISQCSHSLVDRMLDEVIRELCNAENKSEQTRRAKIAEERRAKEETQELRRSLRRVARDDRDHLTQSLQHMGLGREGSVSLKSQDGNRMDEFDMDIALLQVS